MARPVKRRVQTTSASRMADMRDAAMMRSLNFAELSKMMNDIGPGDPTREPVRITINMSAPYNDLLGQFMGAFITVMYDDMVHPGYFTPSKLASWYDLADDVVKHNQDREEVKKTFQKLKKRIKAAEKYMIDMIHYEADMAQIQYSIYDLLLKVSMDTDIDFKGMLPK